MRNVHQVLNQLGSVYPTSDIRHLSQSGRERTGSFTNLQSIQFILSYLILSYLILSYLILSYLILSYLISSYLMLLYFFYFILFYFVLFYFILFYFILFNFNEQKHDNHRKLCHSQIRRIDQHNSNGSFQKVRQS
jgi:hypothetical protein